MRRCNKWKKSKRCFTLLEVMVALAIFLVAAATMGGWRVYRVLEKRRFHEDLKKLQSHLLTCHRLALNMQADWEGILEKRGDQWIFTTRCIDQPTTVALPSTSLHPCSFFFNGEKKERWTIEFSATGEITPPGVIVFTSVSKKEQWKIPEIFQKEADKKKLGPLHPNLLPIR